jgi:hypothetical protein
MEEFNYPKIFIFEKLKIVNGKIYVKFAQDGVLWGKYKDFNGNDVELYRGNERPFILPNNWIMTSIEQPFISFPVIYLPGIAESHDTHQFVSSIDRDIKRVLSLYEILSKMQTYPEKEDELDTPENDDSDDDLDDIFNDSLGF